jgi:hypothetical protein
VLAKDKQFLLLIRHPPCYSYIQSIRGHHYTQQTQICLFIFCSSCGVRWCCFCGLFLFVVCKLYYQFLWIVHIWLSFWCSLALNYLQNTTQKTKDRATGTPLKTRGWTQVLLKDISSRSTSCTYRVTLVIVSLSVIKLLVLMLPKTFKLFDNARTWWRLFQKRDARTKLCIYVFISHVITPATKNRSLVYTWYLVDQKRLFYKQEN